MRVEPGQILLNKYRIDQILGSGGMGMVVKAHHLQLDDAVAIKFLLPDMLRKTQVVKRFLREAQAAVKLKSEHVCRVFDVGTLDNGAPYMVMEFMNGLDLSAEVKRHGRPHPGVAVDYILQACDALAEAHKYDIVHRDLKPANLFLAEQPDGRRILKVLDFGISKLKSSLDEEITNSYAVLGTPAYMSPEQMRSAKNVDQRADIWSLGVILYELLEGARPFRGRVLTDLCLQVAMQPIPPMQAPLPPGLEPIVTSCLAKDPTQRCPAISNLASALAPYAHDQPAATRVVERATRLLGRVHAPPPRRLTTEQFAETTPLNRSPSAPLVSSETQPDTAGPPSTLGHGAGQVALPTANSSRRLWLISGVAIAVLAMAGAFFALGDRDGGSERGASSEGRGLSSQASQPQAPLPADAGAVPVTADTGADAGAAVAPTDHADNGALNTAETDPDRTGQTQEEPSGEVASAQARDGSDATPDAEGKRASSQARTKASTRKKKSTRKKSTRKKSASRKKPDTTFDINSRK